MQVSLGHSPSIGEIRKTVVVNTFNASTQKAEAGAPG